MFPSSASGTSILEERAIKSNMGKSYSFNFSKGDFEMQDGQPVISDEETSIKVWIEKILRTEKNRYKIYDGTPYGCQLEDLIIGNNYPASFVESELQREVSEAILQHPKISSIADFQINRLINSAEVTFSVILKTGAVIQEGVVLDG